MFKSMTTLIAGGLLATSVFAQPAPQATTTAAQPPFVGVISSNDVYVRCGASQNYYPVGKLNTGDMVNVVELLYGWYGIQPPAGSYSLISKQYVTLDADGVTGTVTGNDVRVRAPSPAGTAQSYKIQMKLDTGAKVAVLGTEEEFYRIVPPAGALLYVHQDFLKPSTTQEPPAAALADASTATTEQQTPAPVAEATTPAAETTATETAVLPAPIASTPAAETPVAVTTPAPAETAPMQDDVGVAAVQTTPAPAAPIEPPAPPKNYKSVGKLLTSTIYTGGQMPLLYRLVDSQSGLTIAYIQPPDPYSMLPLLGNIVGVNGDSRYDPGMKLPIIRAREFDTLGPTS